MYKSTLAASTGGVAPEPSSRSLRSLTARSCTTKERQMKDQGKNKGPSYTVFKIYTPNANANHTALFQPRISQTATLSAMVEY